MKRLLTTLIILLVVLVAGMSALVLLVNPNDFRAYMIKGVEQRSGYRLALEGDLRWHIWPQLSILAGQMSLTAPGASAPLVMADNMRLDIKLWPLLSRQLYVKQVMLKNTVVRLTPESEMRTLPGAPIAPAGKQPTDVSEPLWRFDLEKLRLVDSMLIWQRANNEQINVREVNLTLQQYNQRQATLELSGNANRDQRQLSFSLAADLDLQDPEQIAANITQFGYQLEGGDIRAGGIKGEGSVQAIYQFSQQQLVLNQLALSANQSQFSGEFKGEFGEFPTYTLDLSASALDADSLSGWQGKTPENATPPQPLMAAPVIAGLAARQQYLQMLRDFNAQIKLSVDQLTYRGMNIKQFALQADNHQGLLTINTLAGTLGSGDFAFPGSLDVRAEQPIFKLQPILRQIALSDLVNAFTLPKILTGTLSMKGDMTGDQLTADAFVHRWQGVAELAMQNVQLHGFNIQQLVQQAVTRSDSSVRGQESYQRYTDVQQMRAKVSLRQGMMTVNELAAESSVLRLTGAGTLNIAKKQCDLALKVLVTGGWQGNSRLITQLSETALPLRIYGPWQQLNYQLQIEQLLRNSLQDRAKEALNQWIEKNKQSRDGKTLKELLN